MMRFFTAIGEVQRCTPEQVFDPPLNSTAPVSPSTPVSLPLFMYQTMASFVPSVVVAIGDVV